MSSLIPKTFIMELLQNCDLVNLINDYVPLKKHGNSYISCCPFHQEKTPSFNVNAKKQFYYCFGCNTNGNAISFIMQYLNQDFPTAIHTIANKLGISIPQESNINQNEHYARLYALLNNICQYYEHELKNNSATAINYLKLQRSIDGTIAKKYKLGYAPQGWNLLLHKYPQYKQELIASGMLVSKNNHDTYDRYRHRIMFPIENSYGKIIGFGGRALDNTQQPKYLNSPETILFQKKRELYGLHQMLQINKQPEYIIIVEGYFDVIRLVQDAITNTVATLGTAISIYHLQQLNKYTKKIIFCFDGDNAGRNAAWRALENSLSYLNDDLDVRFIFLPNNHDPDSFIRTHGRVMFLQLLETSMSLSEYLLNQLTQNINLNEITGKNQFINNIKSYILKIPESSFRQLLLNEIARLTHMEYQRIETLMNINSKKNIQLRHDDYQKSLAANSPIKLAIAILLQNPEIYIKCQSTCDLYANMLMTSLPNKEQEILQKLLQQIARMSCLTTATIIESWRGHQDFDLLVKLIVWEHQIAPDIISEEFNAILEFLQKQNVENTINNYMMKSRQEGLTVEDKILLQNLLKQRHKNI